MRYQFKWQDVPPEEIPADNQANLAATIHRALELGINHIETARGYGSSEMQLGWVLPDLPREKIIVQTKIAPTETAEDFLATFEKSMAYLRLDRVDLLAFHGVNNDELLEMTLRPGGCLSSAEALRRDGRVGHIGFSTHAGCRTIVDACASGKFDYVNLHWYWLNQDNWAAIEAATRQDMGVFIISPSDKGGRLYEPSDDLVQACAPLTPMGFNDLFCLARPEVHTLSIGAARPSDFDAHVDALAHYDRAEEMAGPIAEALDAAAARSHGADWMARWRTGLPEWEDVPGGVNVVEILRMWTYGIGLGMDAWAKSRYNLLGNGGHWFPGMSAVEFDEAALRAALAGHPYADVIPARLRETHERFGAEAVKRLSQGG
jgi:predicted aldo/keto reductase-like oxidoreductase